MIDLIVIVRIRYKCHRNQSANSRMGVYTIDGENCLSIPVTVEGNSQNLSPVMVNFPVFVNGCVVNASHPSKIAYLVVTLISDSIAPLFYSTTPSSPTICNGQKIPRPLVSAINSPVRIH